jgi:hypothetical protein
MKLVIVMKHLSDKESHELKEPVVVIKAGLMVVSYAGGFSAI